MIKKIILFSIFTSLILATSTFAQEVKKIGKYKDWETIVYIDGEDKVCFAQSVPVLQAPKKIREMHDYLLALDLVIKFQTKSALLQDMNSIIRIQLLQHQENQNINLI